MTIRVIGPDEVRDRLSYAVCIKLIRESMMALSAGRTKQLLRGIIDLDDGNAFGVMPGALDKGPFGAKLVSVFPGNVTKGGMSHQGLIVIFDRESGAAAAIVDAGEVTAIRTAAASAVATAALARPDATRLAILGTGEQALRHIEAIRQLGLVRQVSIWGRDPGRAERLAARVQAQAVPSIDEAVADVDIICTVTAAGEPILFDAQVRDGTHINAVGSSRAGPAELDSALVARARFFADHREAVLAQGAEFLRAKASGLVDHSHVLAEIGDILAGTAPGRLSATDVTIYKSLGNIVQDLACAAWLLQADGRE